MELHGEEEDGGKEEIDKYRFHRVNDRVFSLSDDVAEGHAGGITCKATPGTCHVAVVRNEDDVDGYEYATADEGEPGTPDGAVDEFVPE